MAPTRRRGLPTPSSMISVSFRSEALGDALRVADAELCAGLFGSDLLPPLTAPVGTGSVPRSTPYRAPATVESHPTTSETAPWWIYDTGRRPTGEFANGVEAPESLGSAILLMQANFAVGQRMSRAEGRALVGGRTHHTRTGTLALQRRPVG